MCISRNFKSKLNRNRRYNFSRYFDLFTKSLSRHSKTVSLKVKLIYKQKRKKIKIIVYYTRDERIKDENVTKLHNDVDE